MSRFKDQTELDILQREYRNMEVNRRAFAEETTLVRLTNSIYNFQSFEPFMKQRHTKLKRHLDWNI